MLHFILDLLSRADVQAYIMAGIVSAVTHFFGFAETRFGKLVNGFGPSPAKVLSAFKKDDK